jgi:hypothetical protein
MPEANRILRWFLSAAFRSAFLQRIWPAGMCNFPNISLRLRFLDVGLSLRNLFSRSTPFSTFIIA